MTVSDLLEQPSDKSDNAFKLVTSCQQLVPNLLQQLGTSSANTTCRQLVNRFVTTCLQTCNNLCVFIRVYIMDTSNFIMNRLLKVKLFAVKIFNYKL